MKLSIFSNLEKISGCFAPFGRCSNQQTSKHDYVIVINERVSKPVVRRKVLTGSDFMLMDDPTFFNELFPPKFPPSKRATFESTISRRTSDGSWVVFPLASEVETLFTKFLENQERGKNELWVQDFKRFPGNIIGECREVDFYSFRQFLTEIM